MAIFSVEIADEDVGRVIESLCVNYGWQEVITDPHDPMNTISNPETKPVFANRKKHDRNENIKQEVDS